MHENQGGTPEEKFFDESDAIADENSPNYLLAEEAGAGSTSEAPKPAGDDYGAPSSHNQPDYAGEQVSADHEGEPQDLLSNIVIRRVRTEPVEVIPSPPKDKGMLYSLLDTLRFISLGLVIGILLVVFVVQRNDVYGPSMEPNLHENDAVFVEMISKYFTEPQRGDILTINATGMSGYTKTEKIIKRVVGLPGETVSIKDGAVYINGTLLDEPYLAADVPTYVNQNGTANGYDEISLGTDEYYCMGDNRGASLDSRVLGPIAMSRIKAHVIAKIYPFDDIGLL